MAAKIGIIGKGSVGGALQRGLARAGHDVRAVGKDPAGVRQTAAWADVVFLAVKAFNTVFAQHMDTGHVKGEKLSLLVAADDASAKERVLGLGRDLGFDAIDAGPLRNARWLESFGYLNILLGYVQKLGPDIGFRLVR
ncbi:NADPH-dependent F420 reductase [Corallococcus terminator]|uniref:Pyrroline-5-carboxylate reductase catalytic N-terminal domain-containing protein n=1 Tax=Corallococcus terminator TaxID=2316733 RepID=A0A3A8J5U3_9BACT|nr:NAD(P)-binding domain-containing protein [Corallococcus terminator]RKG91147.1 hypothetical protein D7V88_10045 [Corallococcus terminator]